MCRQDRSANSGLGRFRGQGGKYGIRRVRNDGEQRRISFLTYVPQRMTGFGGVSKRRRGREFEEFPELVAYLLRRFPHAAKSQQGAPEAQAEIKRLKKQIAELEKANEILRSASVFLATELDRPSSR